MTTNSEAGRADRNEPARASDRTIHVGWFQAKYLWPLLPFVEYARKTDQIRFLQGNIQLEPCNEGGAYLVALTGHASLIIRDPEAQVNGPVLLDIPDRAFAVAKGTEMPVMDYCGGQYQPATPEWLQPGRVYVSDAGMFIQPKMRHPGWAEQDEEFHPALFAITASVGGHTVGADYRMTEGRRFDWRRILKNANQAPLSTQSIVYFDPRVPALFDDLLHMLALDDERAPYQVTSHTLTTGDQSSTVIVRFSGQPDIIGLWAGLKELAEGPHPIPAHFLAEVAS